VHTIIIASRIEVSRWYAGRIREGYRPHPRHWEALAELAEASPDLADRSEGATDS
jgi:hypothetical protein